MSITYFSVSLTNNSNSRATIVVLTTISSTVKINDDSIDEGNLDKLLRRW